MSLIIDEALGIPRDRAKIVYDYYLFLKKEIRTERIQTPAEVIRVITSLSLENLEAVRLAYSLGRAEGSEELWR